MVFFVIVFVSWLKTDFHLWRQSGCVVRCLVKCVRNCSVWSKCTVHVNKTADWTVISHSWEIKIAEMSLMADVKTRTLILLMTIHSVFYSCLTESPSLSFSFLFDLFLNIFILSLSFCLSLCLSHIILPEGRMKRLVLLHWLTWR